ncbi:MAG: homoserine kinase [bacterium]|nr:homoserine kinase [bacterium]
MTAHFAEAYAPATVANLGVGFDILGLALREPGDTIRAEWSSVPGITIAAIHGDAGKLPLDPLKNTACVAAASVLKLVDAAEHGIALTIHKGLPAASGLGSSAASAVAGAVAVNALLGEPLSRAALLPACLDGEAVASGYHPDNVAPCLFGGITLAVGLTSDRVFALPVPPALHLALVTPHVEVPTALARAALPQTVSLQQMVAQTASAAELMQTLYTGDIERMAAAMERDSVIEPARQHLMPHLLEVRAAAKRAGACGMVISGAGPTLMAVCGDADTAGRARDAMRDVYDQRGIGASAQSTTVAHDGAKVTRRA